MLINIKIFLQTNIVVIYDIFKMENVWENVFFDLPLQRIYPCVCEEPLNN
jgi:hypothetical protein